MADAYAQMAHAQARLQRVKNENKDLRRQEEIAKAKMGVDAGMKLLEFRNSMLEKDMLNQKTAEGLQKYVMRTDGSFGSKVRRAIFPTTRDFELTPAGLRDFDKDFTPSEMVKIDKSSVPQIQDAEIFKNRKFRVDEIFKHSPVREAGKAVADAKPIELLKTSDTLASKVGSVASKMGDKVSAVSEKLGPIGQIISGGTSALSLLKSGDIRNPIKREEAQQDAVANLGVLGVGLALGPAGAIGAGLLNWLRKKNR